jgi:hypothetical protein
VRVVREDVGLVDARGAEAGAVWNVVRSCVKVMSAAHAHAFRNRYANVPRIETAMNARAFELDTDATHLGDDDTDIRLVRFDGWENTTGLMGTPVLKLPQQIYFEGNFRTLETIDFPIDDVSWPVMSKRMLETLRNVGEFGHRAIPVIILDDTVKDRFDAAGKPRVGVANHEFSAVQLTHYTDAFDWERSEYVRDDLFGDDQVLTAKKLVLKDVPLPPLFRLSALPRPLMVNAAARAALEQAGIKGVRFLASEHVH